MIDITGRKFNRLTAIRFVEKNKHSVELWLFKCDCGAEKVLPRCNVTKHKKPVISCGCAKVEYYEKFKESPRVLRAPGKLYSKYKKRANYKNLEFSISKTEFSFLLVQPCTYCGEVGVNSFSGLCYNGVDRLDNSKGYTMQNCVPCCKYCNQMKSDLTLEEFKTKIVKLYNYFMKED